MKWTILWSKGPVDNPDDGEFEVEADGYMDAHDKAIAAMKGDADNIDAIIRSDIYQDFS